MVSKKRVKIYCCYGSTWNTTLKICEGLKEFIFEEFRKNSIDTEMLITRSISDDFLKESEIVIMATSVMMERFRFNVLKFVKQNAEILKNKFKGLVIVNAPYEHKDYYIEEFEKIAGFKCQVSMTTGGIIDIVKSKAFVKALRDPRLNELDENNSSFGEISYNDLKIFSKKMTLEYLKQKRKGEKNGGT